MRVETDVDFEKRVIRVVLHVKGKRIKVTYTLDQLEKLAEIISNPIVAGVMSALGWKVEVEEERGEKK